MDQNLRRGAVESQLREGRFVLNRVDPLQFGEMVAAADGSKRRACQPRGHAARLEPLGGIAVPWIVEPGQLLDELVELDLAHRQVALPQRHAAADVVADQGRVDHAAADKGRADRIGLAGVKVGHADRGDHAVKPGGGLELAHGFAFDPAVVGSDEANGGGVCVGFHRSRLI